MRVRLGGLTHQELKAERHAVAKAVHVGLRVSAMTVMLSMSPIVQSQSNFGAALELSELDGSDGFVINGIDFRDYAGWSVSGVADINGDRVDDLIIGAALASPNSIARAGESYIVFGGNAVGSTGTIELSGLDGSNGFVINGIDSDDWSGRSVSDAGDINADGVTDLIIGASFADPNGNRDAGESYVLFGGDLVGVSGTVELSELDGSNGFVINGAYARDSSGRSVSGAGDINGDGVSDVIIGAYRSDSNGNSAGESYVVFGGSLVGSTGVIELSELDSSDGFVVSGINYGDRSGVSVAGAGDINGDGVADLIIGAYRAGPYAASQTGESYVVFGGENLGSSDAIELSELDGSDGFVINGIEVNDWSGRAVNNAGDINGDGVDDVVIGARRADPHGNTDAGETYVVLGGNAVGAAGKIELSDLDGSDGFVINGINAADYSGQAVSGAGDINGDGVSDLLIGADGADPNGLNVAGQSYVLFGGSVMGSQGTIELSDLDGSNGFAINGGERGMNAGYSVSSAGDIDGDGMADLIIGAHGPFSQSYVIFGKDVPQCNGKSATVDLAFGQIPGPGPDVIVGTQGNDVIYGRGGDDTICGRGGDDFIHGNSGNDWIDGEEGVDHLRGGQGDDVLHTGTGATVGTLSFVFGGDGDDEINGGIDADDLQGGRGLDTINGNEGNDTLHGDSGEDVLYGGAGDDVLRGGQGDDILIGESGDDILSGGDGFLDQCDGGSDIDSATSSCEILRGMP